MPTSPTRFHLWFLALLFLPALVPALPAQTKEQIDELTALLTRGQALYKKGQVADAIKVYETTLTRAEALFGKTSERLPFLLTELALRHRELGQFAKAEPYALRTLQIREAKLGKGHLDVAHALHNLALIYKDLGHLAKVEPLYRRSLQIYEDKHGKDHTDVADSLNGLANFLWSMGQYAKAEPLHLRALKIRETKLGKDHADVGQSLNNLALLYKDIGQFAKSETMQLQALRIREVKLGKDHPDVGDSLNNLALLYRDLCQFAKAEPLYLRSLQIYQTRRGKDHPDVALALNNLALLYRDMGLFAKAEPLHQQGLRLREAKLGKDHPQVADSLNALALLYKEMGQFAKAEPLYRRCLRIYLARYGKEHPDYAVILNNLSLLYKDMGQYAKAEPLMQRSLRIREEKLGKDHPHVGASLNNLGNLFLALKQFDKAEPLYLRSLEIRVNKLGKDHPEVAGSLNNLAILYKAMNQPAKAEPLYRRSLELYEKRLGPDHPDVALSLNNLGALLNDMGQHAKAELLYRRSLKIREGKLGAGHPDLAQSLNNLAQLQITQGQLKEAVDLLHRARQASRRHVSGVLPSLPPREQATFLALEERNRINSALSLALAKRDTLNLAARSATWLLNGKAVAEEALAHSALLARDSHDPAVGKLARQLREIRAELTRLTLATPASGAEKAHRDRVEALTRKEHNLAVKLAADGGVAIASSEWVGLVDLRRALPADAVFIDVARVDFWDYSAPVGQRGKPTRYVAWVTPAKGAVQLVDLGPAAAIDAAVRAVRQLLDKAGADIKRQGEEEAEKTLREPLGVLSKLVLEPLLPHAGAATRWVVSPDGDLWLTPWEIFLLPDGKYAVEKHALSYVSSGRDLVSTGQFKGKPTRPLIVADPDFDLDGKTARAQTARLGGKAQNLDEVRGLSSMLRLGGVRRLSGTLQEARAIEKPLTAHTKQTPRKLIGGEALEGLVKATKNPRVLVLSTHGFFLPQQKSETGALPADWENPLVRCGLLLAGCNDKGKSADGDDGVLTGLEVVGMDLRGCEMVVLSACETGLGEVRTGEGVAGLRQAFRLAGAEAVVSTLWQVPDSASAELMSAFFANLARSKDKAGALRQAQLQSIKKSRDDKATAHPFFWAAFTITGR